MRTLVILAVALLLYLVLRSFYRKDPDGFTRRLLYGLLGLAMLGVLLLVVSGRLHWLFGLLAGLFAYGRRLLGLFRFLPMLQPLLAALGIGKKFGQGNKDGIARVRSAFLLAELHQASGEIQGQVIRGRFRKRQLRDLSDSDLKLFYHECMADADSLGLLELYLEQRLGSEWARQLGIELGNKRQHRQQSTGATGSDLSKQEALDILGLSEDADEEQIIAAHRRLIQKFHPDRDGNHYLASKINLAKERLLKS